jgi:hypothetical protein
MSKFNNTLKVECLKDRVVRLLEPFEYQSDLLGCTVVVPLDFYSDFASVPRLPVVFTLWGDRAYYESVIHDYLYAIDSVPVVSEHDANLVFKEAMIARGKSCLVYNPMYAGVCVGGFTAYHKRHVKDDPYQLKLNRKL